MAAGLLITAAGLNTKNIFTYKCIEILYFLLTKSCDF